MRGSLRASVAVALLLAVLASSPVLADRGPLERAADLNAQAGELFRRGHFAEALPKAREALALRERALGPAHPLVAGSLNDLALLRHATGEAWEGRRLSERAQRILDQALGPSHPAAAASLNDLALLVAATGDAAGARALYERALRTDVAIAQAGVEVDEDIVRSFRGHGRAGLHEYAGLLARIAREPFRDATAVDPAAQAFVVAEQWRGRTGRAALSRAAVRLATENAATADLARRAQRLRVQLSATRALAATEPDSTRLDALRQEGERLARELADATTRLRTELPRYAELVAPEPADVATTRSLLREGEALVSFLSLEDRVLVWLIRPGRPLVFREQPIRRDDLVALVRRVRGGYDQSANPELMAFRVAPIDFSGAHQLYQLLLHPLAAHLEGVAHLLVVPDEVLLPLPFAALLTRSSGWAVPVELARYPRLPWLVREHAITILPWATSLRTLRQAQRPREAPADALLAFGESIFAGSGPVRRLRGTRDELLAIARALGADPGSSLYLDARATKAQVLTLSADGRLGRTRVLAFATPALLALEDIVTLRLTSTDWVVLSTSTTGTADGGVELAGLTRGLLVAGASSLLVSQWNVDDRATEALMTRVFEAYARDPTLPRAEILRRGMLALLDDARGARDYFAHPFAWAGFFLVGEGDR